MSFDMKMQKKWIERLILANKKGNKYQRSNKYQSSGKDERWWDGKEQRYMRIKLEAN
jgi:hypothetical protein